MEFLLLHRSCQDGDDRVENREHRDQDKGDEEPEAGLVFLSAHRVSDLWSLPKMLAPQPLSFFSNSLHEPFFCQDCLLSIDLINTISGLSQMQFQDPMLANLVTAIYFLIAFWKLALVVQIYMHGPVKQAKKYSMTASITAKINGVILVYTAYVFYEAIMAAFQQPDASQYKLILDLAIKFSFALITLSIFGSMLAELHTNAGLGGAESSKVRFLLRALNRRRMYVFEFLIVMPVLAVLKYLTNGLWLPLLQSVGVPVQ